MNIESNNGNKHWTQCSCGGAWRGSQTLISPPGTAGTVGTPTHQEHLGLQVQREQPGQPAALPPGTSQAVEELQGLRRFSSFGCLGGSGASGASGHFSWLRGVRNHYQKKAWKLQALVSYSVLQAWLNLLLVVRSWGEEPGLRLALPWRQAYCFRSQARMAERGSTMQSVRVPIRGPYIHAAKPDSTQPIHGLPIVICVPWPALLQFRFAQSENDIQQFMRVV